MHIRLMRTKVNQPANENITVPTPAQRQQTQGLSKARVPPDGVGVLCVGINEYSDPSWRLQQCVQDVQRVRKLLMEAYCIPGNNISGLYNQDATKKNIVEKMRKLNEYKYKVYVHSGHGFRIYNQDSGKHEEGLCVYGHNWSRAGMLLDADIYANLNAPERTWLIIDACHSGGLLDKNMLGTKTRVKNIPPPKGAKLGTIKPFRRRDVIGLFACREDEAAYENNQGGVFSTNLVNILMQRPELSFSEIEEELSTLIRHDQHPVIISPSDGIGFLEIGE